MCVVYPNTLISRDEMPKINGEPIKSIYAFKWNEDKLVGETVTDGQKADYFVCYTNNWSKNREIRVKELPAELGELFNGVEHNGKILTVRDLYIRSQDSHNGSFTDQSFSITYGYGKSLSYYRGSNDKMGTPTNAPIIQLVLKSLNKNYKVKELCESQYNAGKNTCIQFIDGLVYPDMQRSGWRRNYKMPYVSNEFGSRDNIRVFMRELNAHVYLQKVEPKKGDWDLVKVSFNRENGNLFCFINSWSNRQETAPNEPIYFDVVKKVGDELSVRAMLNDAPEFREKAWSGEMYKIIKIVRRD